MALTYCDRMNEMRTPLDRLIERARRRGSVGALIVGLSMRQESAYRRGDLSGALVDANEALELARLTTAASAVLLQQSLATLSNVAVERHRSPQELRELLHRVDQGLDHDIPLVGHSLLARARLLLALDEAEPALEQLLVLGRMPRTFGVDSPACIPWRSQMALVLRQLGHPAQAQRVAAEEVELARAMGAARAIGIALRACALVQEPIARDMLEEATGVLERSPARLEHARALVDLGATMRRTGTRAGARQPLRAAYEIANACGSTRLAQRAGREIAATGARVPPVGLRGIEALTPSERRLAELAAQGATNREIAQTLFVTEKTVEAHLGHVYDKLNIRSRYQLGPALAETPTATPP